MQLVATKDVGCADLGFVEKSLDVPQLYAVL